MGRGRWCGSIDVTLPWAAVTTQDWLIRETPAEVEAATFLGSGVRRRGELRLCLRMKYLGPCPIPRVHVPAGTPAFSLLTILWLKLSAGLMAGMLQPGHLAGEDLLSTPQPTSPHFSFQMPPTLYPRGIQMEKVHHQQNCTTKNTQVFKLREK